MTDRNPQSSERDRQPQRDKSDSDVQNPNSPQNPGNRQGDRNPGQKPGVDREPTGEPVKGKAGTADKASEGERTAAGFLLRMRAAEPLVNQFEDKGRPGYGTEMAASVGGAMGRRLATMVSLVS